MKLLFKSLCILCSNPCLSSCTRTTHLPAFFSQEPFPKGSTTQHRPYVAREDVGTDSWIMALPVGQLLSPVVVFGLLEGHGEYSNRCQGRTNLAVAFANIRTAPDRSIPFPPGCSPPPEFAFTRRCQQTSVAFWFYLQFRAPNILSQGGPIRSLKCG